jgi:hypothetical protein
VAGNRGFVGATYNLNSLPASVQRTVNMVPVPLEAGNERVEWSFKDVPGLAPFKLLEYLYVTSRPYAYEAAEDMRIGLGIPQSGRLQSWPEDTFKMSSAFVVSGTLGTNVKGYTNWPQDQFKMSPAFVFAGTLGTPVVPYLNWPQDQFKMSPSLPINGSLAIVLISYLNWPQDQFKMSPSLPITGTLA